MRPLNLVPLIDLFLLLALFGLMLAQFPEALSGGIAQERALRVELPHGEGTPGGGAVLIELSRDGRLALEGKPLPSLKALEEALKALPLGDRPVRLEADREATHGQVVAVMEAVRRAGGKGVQVAVKK